MAASLLPDGTQAESLRSRLEGLVMPVKLLWGRLDRVLPIHAGRRPARQRGAAYTWPATGHLPLIEAAPLVAALVRQQLGAGGFRRIFLQPT